MMEKARLEQRYVDDIRTKLYKQLGFANVNEIPSIEKIVLNVGIKEAAGDSKAIQNVMKIIGLIAGQKPVRTLARKSIAGFKLREGMPIGVKVTLRRRKMYEFLDKLVTLALPTIRDFQGISHKLDGRGNYNLGIKEWTIFPEVDFDMSEKIYGMNITIHTSALNDEHAAELLREVGMPFRK
jgi:large subunit ribosomal protein L5